MALRRPWVGSSTVHSSRPSSRRTAVTSEFSVGSSRCERLLGAETPTNAMSSTTARPLRKGASVLLDCQRRRLVPVLGSTARSAALPLSRTRRDPRQCTIPWDILPTSPTVLEILAVLPRRSTMTISLGPLRWSIAQSRPGPAGESVLTCCCMVKSGRLRRSPMDGSSSSRSCPSPVLVTNTLSPTRIASCANLEGIFFRSSSRPEAMSILMSHSLAVLGRQLCGRETTHSVAGEPRGSSSSPGKWP
mmetsp:Transcript_3947/g.9478  ORF Transcript_3947/g.9478 Transcript_3947/m.9478 type:complete len:247 (-) Transcript_3947:576-1316(-)